jgi:hypothetical protein
MPTALPSVKSESAESVAVEISRRMAAQHEIRGNHDPSLDSHGSDAMRPAALQALADTAEALARLARAVADDVDGMPHNNALLPVAQAARIAAASVRVIRDAIRSGELAAFGRIRDRAVRRADLDGWIENRKVKPIRGVDDADIERRIARLVGAKSRQGSASRKLQGSRATVGAVNPRVAVRRAGR